MKTVAVIPAYNEHSRISRAIQDVRDFVDDVVVVDDGSRDRTAEVAARTGIHVLTHRINRGQGAAIQTGTSFALSKLRPEAIIHFDADGQMQASDIPALLEPIKSGCADVVLGSRFLGVATGMPLTRKITLKGGIGFTMLVSGIRTSDTHNGFRALSKKAAESINITLDRMAHASEILDLIKTNGIKFVERPVSITYSEEVLNKGQSSLGAIIVVKDFFKGKFFG